MLRRCGVVLLGCLLSALAVLPAARAAEGARPVLLVARPELSQFYRATVLLAVPARNGQHIGFIINRPTDITLAELFPEHAPSKLVTDPIFLGGPDQLRNVFAVVNRDRNPGGHSIPLMNELFLAIDVEVVDSIIEKEANHARFFVGMVTWDPGELDAELERGFWYVLQPEVAVVLRKSTQGMWEELVRRAANAL